MVASGVGVGFETIAQGLFGVITQLELAVTRGRRRTGDLKEAEFLTLSLLHEQGTMIVGHIQRLLGVLPAQMSRIIRALEERPVPFIACRINAQDKRKIDVTLTPAGENALLEYQTHRVRGIAELLRKLPEEGQADLSRLLDRLHEVLDRGTNAESRAKLIRATQERG
jgi:DNA-binding MarR family transcriptional regulator